MFFGLIFSNLALSLVPFVGIFLPFVFAPVLSMGMMHACRDINNQVPVRPGILFIGFRSPALRALLLLGFIYTLALVGAAASSIPLDDGALWNYLADPTKADPKLLAKSKIGLGMLIFFLVYAPAAMALWYGAPLIMWHGMSVGKAIFYSFFAVWNARKAFLVYLLAWCGIVSFVAFLMALSGGTLGIIMLPLMLGMSLVMYCSTYATYKDVFSREESA
jgi:hypothetical protein